MCMCLYVVRMCTDEFRCLWNPEDGVGNALEQELQAVVCHLMKVLGTRVLCKGSLCT